jgi:DNA-binding response OmpR family regulator
VLLLTGKGKSDEVILGLSLGADDYLAKPYLIGVFTARVEALLRRAAIVSESVTVGHLRFNMLTNRAYYDSADLLLTQKEFTLLLLLARGGGKTLTFEYLFEKAWGQPMLGDTAPLRVQISGLARKLSAVTDNAVVESVRKRGYRLVSARS